MKLLRLLGIIFAAWVLLAVVFGATHQLFGQAPAAPVSAVEAAAMWSQGYSNGVQSQTPLILELKEQVKAKDAEIAKLTAELKSLKESQ